MKVLIIGGVAAGTKVAAKLKRMERDAQVDILTMSKDISYAGCGLPYYVGDLIHERSELVVNTPEKFAALTGANVETEVEVTGLNRESKTVTALDHKTGETKEYSYDKLVIATGASPIIPPVEGIHLKNVFVMRTPDDAVALRDAIEAGEIKRAVVAGANTAFLADTGIELMPNRTVKVNAGLRTNDPDIYAIGDCAMVTNRLTQNSTWSPMGSSANIEGRMLAQELTGEPREYPGVLGTGICKLPNLNCGRTGLGEAAAKEAGFDPVSVITVVDDKAHYYPGASSFIVKMIADRQTQKLLGLQCMGPGAVDKMIDIAVMAISLGATLSSMEYLDFAYAPPFSTAIHPFAHTLNILLNKINGELDSFTPTEYQAKAAQGYTVLDVSITPTLEEKEYVNLTQIDSQLPNHPTDEKILLVCAKGKRAYLTQNRLKYYGYTNTKVLEGGTTFNGTEIETE